MKERPILFQGAMVRALLAGTKTQTRRLCKPAEAAGLSYVVGIQDPRDPGQRPLEVPGSGWFGDEEGDVQFCSPYGRPGERLWVRETWAQYPVELNPEPCDFWYRADENRSPPGQFRWKPSIHMPRAASRILLEVTGVRVERLQAISEADATAEGIEPNPAWGGTYRNYSTERERQVWSLPPVDSYRSLWDSINGAGSWGTNPWVWVVEFKRAEPPHA